MSTQIGLSAPVPLLAPATATWVAPFALYYALLQNRIVYHRVQSRTALGDLSDKTAGVRDPLYVATRAQMNFTENVPLVLTIALLAELNGGNRTYINYALGALLAFRISHVEAGLMVRGSVAPGRAIGYFGTQIVFIALAVYTAYLVKNFSQIIT